MSRQVQENTTRLQVEQRLTTYQSKLRALKDRSALREVMERELLLTFIEINHGAINEYPLIKSQQASVVELLCGRGDHPGYEYIHQHISQFIVLLVHHEKAVKTKDDEKAKELQATLLNTENLLIKCVQGIVYGMALITDNFEEIVLRYFGQGALKDYSALIEKHELDVNFWKAFVEQFITSRVAEAHREIIEGKKYNISKERNFLVIRFLFDDILSKLNPITQKIDKTRIQNSYVETRTNDEVATRAKLIHSILVKGMSALPKAKELSKTEFIQSARITCIDTVAKDFETAYADRLATAKAEKENPGSDTRSPEEVKQAQAEFKFLMDQVIAVGIGTSITISRTSYSFFKALETLVPEQIEAIRPLTGDFSVAILERILYFLLENHTIHILTEVGRSEGGKIQVRSGRARRVAEETVDGLKGMSKIRKKQLFANDVTREGTLLFKPKTVKQLVGTMDMLSLEPELQGALKDLWTKAIFRVDIMVLLNLELIAKTTTNLRVRLTEILEKYGISQESIV
ncbi:conserved protein of unknown function [Pseudodesulfovibrio profundus]|uniref:Uncharacterized protein n=1 Tax=Pseudodesulfovibrio profundus TaxID=57320 RepID=A0A2C8FCL2_9BACT|nr:hypothetical protein [Pseudodesulfovibrio profundus]SOB59803.1 conserved protein of unknown function [Pseudodesulfovibrio profundus]